MIRNLFLSWVIKKVGLVFLAVFLALSGCLPGGAALVPTQEISQQGLASPKGPTSSTGMDPLTPTMIMQAEALIATFTPVPSPTPTTEPFPPAGWNGVQYVTQPGDTLEAVARRYSVESENILSDVLHDEGQFLIPGQFLYIPMEGKIRPSALRLLPDSEIVYGPSAAGFSTQDFLLRSNGSLREYQEWLESSGWTSAAQVIDRIALENSVNPRLLITLLDWECDCVAGKDQSKLESKYVLGVEDYHRKSLYGQLSWMARSLADGYYNWRIGQLPDDFHPELAGSHYSPDLNAGTVALLVYFNRLKLSRETGSKPITPQEWELALDPQAGVSARYSQLFNLEFDLSDPKQSDEQASQLLPVDLTQPSFILPFEPGKIWSFTSGPHPAWENVGALSALDFAPSTDKSGCQISPAWALAVADGPVVRSKYGVVVQDIEYDRFPHSDGYEGSGWAVVYLHIAEIERVQAGTYLKAGDPIGHPSCEGGPATGTHLHIARKYNGEWIAAGGPVPFILDGWTTLLGPKPYEGHLVKEEMIITANVFGIATSWISRPKSQTKP